jgi:heme-degrading monooxygenase HmoA
MDTLVEDIPGFISQKSYTSDDGDAIVIVRFESHDALRAWREHPEHAEAQRRGKAEIYASYDVEVCEVTRAYAFP